MKAMPVQNGGVVIGHMIFCPGCKCGHLFDHRWHFNGDTERPTFGPLPSGGAYSMLVNQSDPGSRCHSFVENGKIRFLGDCWHELKNQTVDLEDIDKPSPTETAPETERVEPLNPDGGRGGESL